MNQANLVKTAPAPPLCSLDFHPLIDEFLAAQDLRTPSKATYRRGLRPFMRWLAEQGERMPDRNTILRYKAWLVARGTAAATVSSYLVALRKFFEWAEGVRHYPNIARGIKGSKPARGFRKEPLTVDQIKALLAGVDRSTLQGRRDYALLNLLIRTGLRTIEIIRADVGDISQSGGEGILRIQGKGRDEKDEQAVLTPATLGPLYEYLHARRAQEPEPLFTSLSDRNPNRRLTTRSVSRVVKQHLRAIHLDSPRLTAHSLRHTAVTLSLLAGATLQEAQTMARHTSINTTMIYAHNINRITQAAERKIDALLAEGGHEA